MRRIINNIPNTITLLNLFSGCVGITAALNGDLVTPFYCMVASLIFDFLDGFMARLLRAYSPMGKELDSLADMVSFGVLPSTILYTMGLEYFAFIIALFSALRLAKFNIDTRQSDGFLGLATPANAIFFGAVGYLSVTMPEVNRYISEESLTIAAIIMSLLLVTEIPMFALKFKSISLKKDGYILLFIMLSVITFAILQVLAIPFIVIGYILLSIVRYIINKIK